MNAEEALRAGNLPEALAALQSQIKADPAAADKRIFLFQLLAVMGQWDRALTQLNVLADLDASTLAMAQMYRTALRCEVLRAEVFAGKRTPLVFGEPVQWIALLINAMQQSTGGNESQADALRAQAYELAPAVTGTIDDTPFEWIADADSRFGPVLEAIVDGKYYWVPFDNITSIHFDPPEDLRDLVWMPAQFVWANAGQSVGLIPTRYPSTAEHSEGELLLARKTEWQEVTEQSFYGLGQRILMTNVDEYPLLNIKQINLDSAASNVAGSSTSEQQ